MSTNINTVIFAGINMIILLSVIVGVILLAVCLVRRKRAGAVCNSCSKKIPQDANVCPYCGQKQ